ncbi:hypothetical protein DPMN_033049 [Dreissena polymorpha]|uniref:Uncharacterized protein n=1 Tax=Dreissena polymorpha TaxID=45954 RepID=A0A9D4M7S8_DREPO|nr:hypothetical protein DPMN_033049 [Dreissena polymorpha]
MCKSGNKAVAEKLNYEFHSKVNDSDITYSSKHEDITVEVQIEGREEIVENKWQDLEEMTESDNHVVNMEVSMLNYDVHDITDDIASVTDN